MPVDPLDMPAETGPLRVQVIDIDDVIGISVKLQLVVVGECDKITQVEVRCGDSRLPDLPLLRLTVTDDQVGVGVLLLDLLAECDTDSGTRSLSKGSGGEIHTRRLIHVAVAREIRPILVQSVQPLFGEVTLQCKGRIDCRTSMALREDCPVTILSGGILRVHSHLMEIEVTQKFDYRHGSADMA